MIEARVQRARASVEKLVGQALRLPAERQGAAVFNRRGRAAARPSGWQAERLPYKRSVDDKAVLLLISYFPFSAPFISGMTLS